MRAFARVAGELSFAAAARSLDVDPATVTRLIASLESLLGTRLLQRSSRGVSLTAVGQTYLSYVHTILATIDEANAIAGSAARAPAGRVRVLATTSFASHQLAKRLPLFYEKYPDIALDLSNTGSMDGYDEQFDVSIMLTRSELRRGDFVARRLAETNVVMCASPGYLEKYGVPVVPTDISAHRALLSPVSVGWRTWQLTCRESGAVVELAPQGVLTAQNAEMLLSAAIAGLGIAPLPSYVANAALNEGSLVQVLQGWTLGRLTIYAVSPSTRKFLPTRTQAFIEFLKHSFRSGGDPWLPS